MDKLFHLASRLDFPTRPKLKVGTMNFWKSNFFRSSTVPFFFRFHAVTLYFGRNIHFINKSDKKYWTGGEPLLRQTKKKKENFEDTDKPTCLLFESQSGSKPNQTPALCWLYLSYLLCFPLPRPHSLVPDIHSSPRFNLAASLPPSKTAGTRSCRTLNRLR